MFPIFSLMRRFAATHIYATDHMLSTKGGRKGILLDRASCVLDMNTAKWVKSKEFMPFSEVRMTSQTSVEVAVALSAMETSLAEDALLSECLYTLVLAPESESKVQGGFERVARYAIVQGVFRASSSRMLESASVDERRVVKFRPLPKGTVRL